MSLNFNQFGNYKIMIETISIKSVENTLIEFDKHILCNVSKWLSDIITNMDEKDIL